MKLLFENWREYISEVEEEEEEQPDTMVQKLQTLFFDNTNHAMHIAGQLPEEVDPKLMELMRTAVEAAHDMIHSYLYYTEAVVAGDAKYVHGTDSGWIIKGDGFEQRRYHSKEERSAFRGALQDVGMYPQGSGNSAAWLLGNSEAENRVVLIFTELYNGTVWPEKTKDDPKEAQIYKDAVEWAGTPPKQ